MSLKTDAYYRSVADRELRSAGLLEPPIDLDAVAARLRGAIVPVALPACFQAAAVDRAGTLQLVLNSALTDTSRRRCLAHLLGHVLAAADEPAEGYPRDTERGHHAAEVIAEELMLPSHLVAEQAAKWFNDHRYLARLFGVSEADMLVKMRELGLVKSKGLIWDY